MSPSMASGFSVGAYLFTTLPCLYITVESGQLVFRYCKIAAAVIVISDVGLTDSNNQVSFCSFTGLTILHHCVRDIGFILSIR